MKKIQHVIKKLRLSGIIVSVLMLGNILMPAGASLVQEHYRWRNDDGSESSATWKTNANTVITGVTRGVNIRLRFCISNTGPYNRFVGPQLQYSTSTSGPWNSVTNVQNGLEPFEMTASPNYNNGDLTTAQLTGTGSFVAGRMVEYPTNTAMSVTINSKQYSNFEYCFRATAKARGSTTYYFRVSGCNTYNHYATLIMASGEANEPPIIIVSSLTATTSVGSVFNYQIWASGSEPITYNAINLPSGLTFGQTNMITGQATGAGTYSIGLVASNTWGVDNKTLVLTVKPNIPPVASNGSFTAISGIEASYQLRYSNPETNQKLTFYIVSKPQYGRILSVDRVGWVTYHSDNYVGGDVFTWKVNDGVDESNIATVNVTVNPGVPRPSEQDVSVQKDVTTDITPYYTGGGGYSSTIYKVSGPYKGSVVVTNRLFRYTPNTGYEGIDSFTWYMKYWQGTNAPMNSATVTCTVVVKEKEVNNDDWPTFRGDVYRSATTTHSLPDDLSLHWRRDLPGSLPGWSMGKAIFYNIDVGYEPIVGGDKLFVGLNFDGSIRAYNITNGVEVWRFYTEGPVRVAPVFYSNRVYAVSDDGWLYCIRGEDGGLEWKRRGGPSNRKAFGNGRMVSSWPCRIGPMIAGGKLIWGAGLFGIEGEFLYGTDPVTGTELWHNDEVGVLVFCPPHDDGNYVVAGVAMQGYIVRRGDNTNSFFVAASYSLPPEFRISDGSLVRWKTAKSSGGSAIGPDGEASFSYPTVVTAGGRIYTARTASALGVVGTVHSMLAAKSRLFVVTRGSNPCSIYCFGSVTNTAPIVHQVENNSLRNVNDRWKDDVTYILNSRRDNSTNGVAMVWGIGDGRVAEELVKQSVWHVVCFDGDSNKVATVRRRFVDAGYYGSRVWVINEAPSDLGLPPYMARVVMSEDMSSSGFSEGVMFVKRLFDSIRPYGGEAWLPTTESEHSTFSGWVAVAELENADLRRENGYSVLRRVGKLKGAVEFKSGSVITNADERVKLPFGVSWYGDIYGVGEDRPPEDVANGYLVGSNNQGADVYTGIQIELGIRYSGGKSLKVAPPVHKNPLFGGLRDSLQFLRGYGCGSSEGTFYGNINTVRSAAIGYLDRVLDSGMTHFGHMRASCGSGQHDIPANGLLVIAQEEGCGCAYQLGTSAGLVHRSDCEYWSRWGVVRLKKPVEDIPVKRVGINLGAPGDRNEGGTLWLHQPLVGGTWIGLSAELSGINEPRRYYNHMSRVSGELPWVTASGLVGATNISLQLCWPIVALRTSSPPVLDGILDDSCWDGLGQIKLTVCGVNYKYLHEEPPAGYVYQWPTNSQCKFWGNMYIRYDASNLYFAGYAPRWNNNSYGDGWSLFISDMNSMKWIRFTVITNSKSPGIDCGVKENWMKPDEWRAVRGNWDVRVKTGAGGTNFTAEFRIGWDLLAREGFNYQKLIFNSYGPKGIQLNGCNALKPRSTQFMPLWYDTAEGLIGQQYRPYKVRLYFAEPGLARVGERVFDVKLQGKTVLNSFDIVREAGGQWRSVMKEFNTFIGDKLEIDLVPVVGESLISGIEVIGEYQQPNLPPVWQLSPATNVVKMALGTSVPFAILSYTRDPEGDSLSCTWWKDGVRLTKGIQSNVSFYSRWWYDAIDAVELGKHKIEVRLSDSAGNTLTNTWIVYVVDTNNPQPEAVAVVEPLVGVVPLSVSFNGSGSWDTNGSIVEYRWDFGDGVTATGAVVGHVYNTPGVYRTELTVVDDGGMVNSTGVMIYAMTPTGSPWEAVDSDGDGVSDYYDNDDDNDGIPDWWEIAYGLKRRDGGDANGDADGDGLSNKEEYMVGTNPLDPMSGGIRIKNMGNISVIFEGWSGKLFSVEYKEDLMDTNAWNVLTNILGSGQTIEVFDPSAGGKQKRFYRLKAR